VPEAVREIEAATARTIARWPRVHGSRQRVTASLVRLAEADPTAVELPADRRRYTVLRGEGRRYLAGELPAAWQPHPARSHWPAVYREPALGDQLV